VNYDPLKPTKDFLDSITARKSPDTYLPEPICGAPNSVGKERRALSLRILRRAGVCIPSPLTEIYEQEQLSRIMGAHIVKDLVNGGYMLVYQYHPSRRGGAMRIPRVLEQGGWN